MLSAENAVFQATVKHPEWGNIEILHPGDLDGDELLSIVESGIEATIRMSEEALFDARDVELLSLKATAVLERAHRMNRPGVVELSGSLDELAYVGKRLLVAAQQGGRPESLWETAARFATASKAPESWVDPDRPNKL